MRAAGRALDGRGRGWPITLTDPNTLPRADQQRVVVTALASVGARGRRVFRSKFDWLFGGAAPRSATFEVTLEGQQTWADVHFFDRTVGTIVACSGRPNTPKARTFSVAVDGGSRSRRSSGLTRTTITVDGKPFTSEGSQDVLPLVGDRFFVLAWDARTAAALRRPLGLATPSC